MGWGRKIFAYLGFPRDDGPEVRDRETNHRSNNHNSNQPTINPPPIFQETGPRRGFGVPVQVAVDRPQPGPVLLPCTSRDGGVQGLKWYAKSLRMDEDGDVADEFLEEVLPGETSGENEQRPFPTFQVKYNTRPAKVKDQVLSHDGKVLNCVEFEGSGKWI